MDQNKANFNTVSANQYTSSLLFCRLTQYYAIHCTMHCKVPSIYRIFVMQTESNQTKKPKYMSRSIASKFALALTFALTMVSTSFANIANDDHNAAVTASFHKDFKKAELLTSETGKNYTKLTFRMNDMVLFAFYSEEGQLLAVTRNIKSNQLPINLLLQVKQDYATYWISELFEFNSDGTNTYYITLENADSSITLRASGTDSWDVYSKKTKE